MLELLQRFSIENIFIFIILLALAIKGLISFFDWAKERFQKAVLQSNESFNVKKNIKEHEQQIHQLKSSIQQINKLIRLLIESDKDDIKAFITRQHHYFVYQKGWIDDYSLDCIEQRYSHYENQGGNSFIGSLMKELRALPKQPPTQSN